MNSEASENHATLGRLRDDIDRVDAELVEVLNRRARLVHEAFRRKRAEGSALYDGRRVLQILSSALAHNDGPLTRAEAERLLGHVLDFFGLEYETEPRTSRGGLHVPEPLHSTPRPWIAVDVPGALPPALEGCGVRLVPTCRCGEEDVREVSTAGPATRASAVLATRHPGDGALGAWLREVHATARRAGPESLVLLLQPGAAEDLRRLVDRTSLPVFVDARGGRLEEALEGVAEGADGMLIACDEYSPTQLGDIVVRARDVPGDRRRPVG